MIPVTLGRGVEIERDLVMSRMETNLAQSKKAVESTDLGKVLVLTAGTLYAVSRV